MKYLSSFLFRIGFTYAVVTGILLGTEVALAGDEKSNFGAGKLGFTENRGQITDMLGAPRPDLLFSAHANGMDLFLSSTTLYYQFQRTIYPEGYRTDLKMMKHRLNEDSLEKRIKTETFRFSISLEQSNPQPEVSTELQSNSADNFYLFCCPNGITNVRSYGKLILHDVYPGIDWVLHSNGAGLKYDFVVHPGASPKRIKLRISNAEKLTITPSGDAVFHTSLGDVTEQQPVSFVGDRQVSTSFHLVEPDLLSFLVSDYDKAQTLVIDPSVVWASYYGGSDWDEAKNCTVDASGNVYMAGQTTSTSNIASSGGFQTTYGGGAYDAYVVKFDSSGSRIWSTYYGGSGNEDNSHVVVDKWNNVYLSGGTSSANSIATANAYQSSIGSYADAYLAKFNSNGVRIWGTYYGGDQGDGATGCAVDDSGNVYLAGATNSTSLVATPASFQMTYGGGNSDAFLAKFDSSGTLNWATYLGGANDDQGYGCATDLSGNICVFGITNSPSGIASPICWQSNLSGFNDAFLAKFNSTGTRIWSTYYGGPGDEYAYACTTDSSGNIYLGGQTSSDSNIASPGSFQEHMGGYYDAFLVKFNRTGGRKWGTFYGDLDPDYCAAITAGKNETVYMTGTTMSASGIATQDGIQPLIGGQFDAFTARFDSAGSRKWGTYYGGFFNDYGYGSALDTRGNLYIAGATNSTSGIATLGSFQNNYGGGTYDGFISKIRVDSVVHVTESVGNATAPFSATVYPNPTSDIITLSLSSREPEIVSIQLTDVLGRIAFLKSLQTYNTHENRIDLPVRNLMPGCYTYRVMGRSGEPLFVGKFIKK